jgi:outer membrane protein
MNDVVQIRRWAGRAVARLVVATTVLAGSALHAQDAPRAPQQPLTEAESVRLGLSYNARIRGADAGAAEARAVQREARASLLPSLRGAANYLRIGGDIPAAEFVLPGMDTAITLLPVERDRYHVEVSVEQPLFTGGRLREGVRAATLQADAAERLAEQERADLAFEIRQAYWTLYGAQEGLGATDAALARVDAHLEDVRNRFEAGAALRSELLATQTRRSEIMLERVESRNAVRVARLELNRLLGLPLTAEVTLAADVAVAPLTADLVILTQTATARPQLQALTDQVSALRAQLSAAQGGRLPDVSFLSRYIYARPNPYAFTEQASFRGTWETGLSLQWRAWEGGAQSARVAQIRERLRAADARLEEARRQAEVAASRRYLEAERAAEAVTVAAANVEQAGETLRVTRQQYFEGVVLSSDALAAEQAYQQAQARHARARAEYAIASAALLHAAGVVW